MEAHNQVVAPRGERVGERARERGVCVCVCGAADGHPSLSHASPRRPLADHHAIVCARMRDRQREAGATAITGNSVACLTLMLPVTNAHLDKTDI